MEMARLAATNGVAKKAILMRMMLTAMASLTVTSLTFQTPQMMVGPLTP